MPHEEPQGEDAYAISFEELLNPAAQKWFDQYGDAED